MPDEACEACEACETGVEARTEKVKVADEEGFFALPSSQFSKRKGEPGRDQIGVDASSRSIRRTQLDLHNEADDVRHLTSAHIVL